MPVRLISIMILGTLLVLSGCSKLEKPLSATELLDLGEKYLLELDYEQALVQFLKVIEIDPMNPRGYTGAAEAYVGLGDTDSAIAILRRGLDATGDADIAARLEAMLADAGKIADHSGDDTGDAGVNSSSPDNTYNEGDGSPSPDDTDDYIVEWSDSGFEQMIRSGLGKPTGDIMRSELDFIWKLEIYGDTHIWFNDEGHPGNRSVYGNGVDAYVVDGVEYGRSDGISELSDAIHFRQLRVLSVNFTNLNDLSVLPLLTDLSALCLEGHSFTDISVMSEMVNLYALNLQYNLITDISPLAGLTNLTGLWLYYNEISDITPLSGLYNLQSLSVGNNDVSDIRPLAGLVNITVLHIQANQISDISPLSGMTGMTELYLSHNAGISDLGPLAEMKQLNEIYLWGTSVTDLSPISHVSVISGPNA